MTNLEAEWVIIIGNLKIEKRSRGTTNGSKWLKLVKHTEQETWGKGHSNSCYIWQHWWINYDWRHDTAIHNWWWTVKDGCDKLKSRYS